MQWIIVVGVAVILVVAVGVSFAGRVGDDAARVSLREGARVIDVRTRDEFRARHLPGAINIPLGELTESIGQQVPDKETVVLLHCQSGGRSGVGVRLLKRLGYQRAYNLGSYSRAERMIEEAGSPQADRPQR